MGVFNLYLLLFLECLIPVLKWLPLLQQRFRFLIFASLYLQQSCPPDVLYWHHLSFSRSSWESSVDGKTLKSGFLAVEQLLCGDCWWGVWWMFVEVWRWGVLAAGGLQRWTLRGFLPLHPWPPGSSHHARRPRRLIPVHRPGAADRRVLRSGKRAGLLGGVPQQQPAEHHQLLRGVPGGGWHRCGSAGHPLRHRHQHRLLLQLLRLPVHRVLRPGPHSELHLQPPCYRYRPLHRHQDTAQVSQWQQEKLKHDGLLSKAALVLVKLWKWSLRSSHLLLL